MKVFAVIPVHGRLPLVKWTVSRLLNVNGCHAVICAGETEEEREVCEMAGAVFIEHPNSPLGKKWNACFQRAGQMGADACLFVGSGDWVSELWIPRMLPHLDKYAMIGKAGFHMLDYSDRKYRLCYWSGYEKGLANQAHANQRKDEPIGIGRMLSRKTLKKLEWSPFNDHQNESLDWVMYLKCLELKGGVGLIRDESIQSLSWSCDLWPNKHTFRDHWNNTYPSKQIPSHYEFCNKWFPDWEKVFQHPIL